MKAHAPIRPTPARATMLLLGNYRPAIAVAQALKSDGHQVIAGQEGEPLGAHCSRYVDAFWDHPPLKDDPAAFLEALMSLLMARPDIKAVVPVSEEFAVALARYERTIRQHTLLASPARRIVSLFSDKLAALTLAHSLGVPTLPFACVEDRASLLEQAERIGYPLTVRGLGTTARVFSKKALILADAQALTGAIAHWPDGHDRLLLQRFAAGHRHNLYFAARAGKLTGMLEAKILRTNALDGTGLAVDGITKTPDDQLVADLQKLITATNYTGIGLAQFIIDPTTGQRCFLELNPRISGSHVIAEQAGLPLSRMAVELARRATPDVPANAAVKPGLRYVWTGGDLLAAKQALADGEITIARALGWAARAIWSALRADFHMICSWRDPGPALISMLLLLPRCSSLRQALRRNFAAGRIISSPRDVSPRTRTGDIRGKRKPGVSGPTGSKSRKPRLSKPIPREHSATG